MAHSELSLVQVALLTVAKLPLDGQGHQMIDQIARTTTSSMYVRSEIFTELVIFGTLISVVKLFHRIKDFHLNIGNISILVYVENVLLRSHCPPVSESLKMGKR